MEGVASGCGLGRVVLCGVHMEASAELMVEQYVGVVVWGCGSIHGGVAVWGCGRVGVVSLLVTQLLLPRDSGSS